MNANLEHPAPTKIDVWLKEATAILTKSGIPSARLDAELLLGWVLQKDRTYLIAHVDEYIPPSLLKAADDSTAERVARIPLAYIFGHKEFYGRSFWVNQHVLIPRPETETIVELAKKYIANNRASIIDVGTGSGAIAITLAAELPRVLVDACDISKDALKVAVFNNKLADDKVTFFLSDLLDQVNKRYDVIVANLPYIDHSWERSPETDHEPSLALFAENNGLELIYKLIDQSKAQIENNGYILLEADPTQHGLIITFANSLGYKWIESRGFIVVLQMC